MFDVNTEIDNDYIYIKVTYNGYSSDVINERVKRISICDSYKINEIVCECINDIKIQNVIKEIRYVKNSVGNTDKININIHKCYLINKNPVDIVFNRYHNNINIRSMNILYKKLYNLVLRNVTCSLLDAILYPDISVKKYIPDDILFLNYIK
jgi:hypothetical protein